MGHSVPGANLRVDEIFVVGETALGRKIKVPRRREMAHHAVRPDSRFVKVRLLFPTLRNVIEISPTGVGRREPGVYSGQVSFHGG
jgi:hypothetical protein